MPSDPTLVRAVMRRWELADYIAPEDLARMAVQAVLKAQEPEREQTEGYRDLLTRIGASLADGTLDVPDVAHAVEVEIAEALGVRSRPAASGDDA